nr:MAG TPA: hypothetical protein [Caudoviricetes sp.]
MIRLFKVPKPFYCQLPKKPHLKLFLKGTYRMGT